MQKEFQRKMLQQHADELASMKSSLQLLEQRIQKFQCSYLTRNYQHGNVLLGWTNEADPEIQTNQSHSRIQLTPKDKIFSLSSANSQVNFDLTSMTNIADRNLVPFGYNKFKQKQKSSRSYLQERKLERKEGKCQMKQGHKVQRRVSKKKYDFRDVKQVSDYKSIEK